MNDLLMQCQAEVKVLEYKLDKIKKRIESRKDIVDPITKKELEAILAMISQYESVPVDWNLDKPLVIEEASKNV